jgi:hypothetical protein
MTRDELVREATNAVLLYEECGVDGTEGARIMRACRDRIEADGKLIAEMREALPQLDTYMIPEGKQLLAIVLARLDAEAQR